nr:MAG TPA: hypothetical protein [Caudoviricetes sp.]
MLLLIRFLLDLCYQLLRRIDNFFDMRSQSVSRGNVPNFLR